MSRIRLNTLLPVGGSPSMSILPTASGGGGGGYVGESESSGSIFEWLGSIFAWGFTVEQSATVTKVRGYCSQAVSAGAEIGIASDWTGSGTIPWLGKGIIASGLGGGQWTGEVTLESSVTLSPGTTYRFVFNTAAAGAARGTLSQTGCLTAGAQQGWYGGTFSSNWGAANGYAGAFRLISE